LSIEAAQMRGIGIAGIVFLDAGEIPTPKDLLAENKEAIERFSGIPVAGVIGHIRNFFNPGNEYVAVFDRILK
jgi:dethiobiotin synthetase